MNKVLAFFADENGIQAGDANYPHASTLATWRMTSFIVMAALGFVATLFACSP